MRRSMLSAICLVVGLSAPAMSVTAAELAFDDGENLVRGQAFGGLPTLPGFGQGVTLPTFDTSLGTLDSAELSWLSTLTLSGDAIDGNVFGAGFEFSADGSIEVFATLVDTGPFSVSGGCLSIGCDVFGVLAASSSAALNLSGALDLTGEAAVQTAGPGTFDVDLNLSAGLGPLPHDFDDGSFEAAWDVTMQIVTYTFTPVPLPPAAALLAPAGLLLVRRRRRA